MMHHVPQAGLAALAVAGPVERVVRQHCEHARRDGFENCHALASLAFVQLTLEFEG